MKRTLLAIALAAIAAPIFAQSDSDKLIARVNGREITNRQLDDAWVKVPAELQERFLDRGGKRLFLENYISKRLVVDEAIRSGFAKKVGMDGPLDVAGESALFDRYVRDVVAAPMVTEADMKKVYEEHRSEFKVPEQAKLRLIRVMKASNPDAAREKVANALIEIFAERTAIASRGVGPERLAEELAAKFSEVASRVSDDASAADGGQMPWTAVQTIPTPVADAARAMKTGTISGVLETRDAFQIILKEGWRGEGEESFEAAEGSIREYIYARNAQKIMQEVSRKTTELRAAAKVEIFAENIQ